MNFNFTPKAWEEYLFWQLHDKKTLKKINDLLKDIARNPIDGIGKPEPLKENLSGYWSRRINSIDRLIYRYDDANDTCEINQCKGHYDDY